MQMQDAAEMKRRDGITSRDRQDGIDMAWHRKTNIIEAVKMFLTNPMIWINLWDVVKTRGTGAFAAWEILTATDDGQPIGEPFQGSYTPITNKQFVEIMENSTAGAGMQLVSCGSIKNRSQVFASFALPEAAFELRKGDVWKPFLNFYNGHGNMQTGIGCNTSIWRSVCENSVRRSLRDVAGSIVNVKLKHTKNLQDRIPNIAEICDAYVGTSAQFAKQMRILDAVKVDKTAAAELVAGFFGKRGANNEPVISPQGKNRTERVVALFDKGAGNRGESLLDVFNGFTDFYTHESRGGDNRMAQYLSSEYGDAADAKEDVLNMLLDDDRRETVAKLGRELITS